MRPANAPASLGELLGSASKEKSPNDFSLEDLPELLGEKMPEMPKNRLGRFRLINALQQRFGNGYSNIPGVKKIISQFDQEIETENTIRLNKKGRS